MSCFLHVAIVCTGLTAPANGGITFTDGNNFGSAATYSCVEGFAMTGAIAVSVEMARVCLGEGAWTGRQGSTCDGKQYCIQQIHIANG